jgi:hypothetical protein
MQDPLVTRLTAIDGLRMNPAAITLLCMLSGSRRAPSTVAAGDEWLMKGDLTSLLGAR